MTSDRQHDEFAEKVGEKAVRKAQAREHGSRGTMWFGLGTFGMVGWSIVIPTVIGVLLGTWLDNVTSVDFSWRLTLMFLGLIVGCWNAWYWVSKEHKRIEAERKERRKE